MFEVLVEFYRRRFQDFRMADILLCESEKTFILHGVQEDMRIDGRKQRDYRPIELETDYISNTSGSSRLRLANTEVIVGVKAELGSPDTERPNEGVLKFFVDCSATATPEFEGRGGEVLALEISSTLQRAFQNNESLDLKLLSVIAGQQCWILFVDILVLECGGNLFDAVSLAVKAALFATKLPNVTITMSDNGETELEISDDPYDFKRLDVSRVPCLVTLTKIGHSFVVDPCLEEEHCSLGSLVLGISELGKVSVMKKMGSGSFHPESVFEAIETATQIGVLLNKQLLKALQEEEKSGKRRLL